MAAAQPAVPRASPDNASASGQAKTNAATQAHTLYEKGRLEAVAGDWQAAYATLRAAYAWSPQWQIAGGLGDAAFVIGKYPEAVEMLSQHLREATNLTAQERSDSTKRLAEATKKCGALSIDGPSGSEVKMDGAPLGRLPLPRALYVLPGVHTVEVVAPVGAGGTKQTVTVAAGESARVTAPLAASQAIAAGVRRGAATTTGAAGTAGPGPRADTAPTVAQSSAGETKPSLVPAAVLGASSLVALGAGLGIFAWSEAKGGEASAALGVYDRLPGAQQTASARKVVGDLLREQDSLLTGAWIGWISAAVLGTGAIGYSLYRVGVRSDPARQASTSQATVQWSPAVSPQGAGVVVQGSF